MTKYQTTTEKTAAEIRWRRDCMRWHGRVLTGNYQHYCMDWDSLPIDDTCEEFGACDCPKHGKPLMNRVTVIVAALIGATIWYIILHALGVL